MTATAQPTAFAAPSRNVTPIPRYGLGKVLHYADENGKWGCGQKFKVDEIRIRKGTVIYMGRGGIAFAEHLVEPDAESAWKRWNRTRKRVARS